MKLEQREAFVNDQEVYDLGVPFDILSMWMTNGLVEVAYKNKYERFFWKNEILKLKDEYMS